MPKIAFVKREYNIPLNIYILFHPKREKPFVVYEMKRQYTNNMQLLINVKTLKRKRKLKLYNTIQFKNTEIFVCGNKCKLCGYTITQNCFKRNKN